MWIIDIPDMGLRSRYSKILEPNRTYTLGRQNTDITIFDEKKKLSRQQLSITMANDDLTVENIGQALFSVKNDILPKNFKLFYKSSEVHDEITFQMLNNSWFFKLFHIDLGTIKVGDRQLHNKLIKIGLNNFKLDGNLDTNQILIDNNDKPTIIESKWMDELLNAGWKTNGGLNKIIKPDLESKSKSESKRILIDTSNSSSDSDSSDFSENDGLPKRGKSQLDTMLDRWDVFEPIQIEKSHKKTEAKKIKDIYTEVKDKGREIKDKDVEIKDRNTGIKDKNIEIKESLERLHLKRTIDEESSKSHKKLKAASYLEVDLAQQEEKPVESRNIEANNDKLVDAFKKVKEIRKKAVDRDKELIKNYKVNSDIKIKKFSIDMTVSQTNRKYQNSSSSNKSKWDNRINYKNFKKVSSGYNPITDSTIKCIKLKKANYKSNTLQINIDDQFLNDPIPELDNQFTDPTRKRRMEFIAGQPSRQKQFKKHQQSLFLNDDDDNNDDNDHGNDDDVEDLNESSSFIPTKFQDDRFSRNLARNTITANQFTTTGSDDDEIPIFKSRRR